MSCCMCCNKCQSQPKMRYNPTYYHHPIFDFCVTAKPTNPPSTTSKPFSKESPPQTQTQCKTEHQNGNNQSGTHQSQGEPNGQPSHPIHQLPKTSHSAIGLPDAGNYNPISHHTLLWFDQCKSILLRKLANCQHHTQSRERKLLELSSCPFYSTEWGFREGQKGDKEERKERKEDEMECPICGGWAYCQRCRTDTENWKRWICDGVELIPQGCSCGPCKKCGNSFAIQQLNNTQPPINCQNCGANPSSCGHNQPKNDCASCLPKCTCGPNCVCGPCCKCCLKMRSTSLACGCSQGKCKCGTICNCGIICKCCPKFKAYEVCRCGEGCRCGQNCSCGTNCKCCPKNLKVSVLQPTLHTFKPKVTKCGCAPECGCGPECRCDRHCKCEQAKERLREHPSNGDTVPKQSKKVQWAGNGKDVKKTRTGREKEQPVFRSVTIKRR